MTRESSAAVNPYGIAAGPNITALEGKGHRGVLPITFPAVGMFLCAVTLSHMRPSGQDHTEWGNLGLGQSQQSPPWLISRRK